MKKCKFNCIDHKYDSERCTNVICNLDIRFRINPITEYSLTYKFNSYSKTKLENNIHSVLRNSTWHLQ